MNGEVKRNISPLTGRRFCFRGFQPLLDPLGIVPRRAAILDRGKRSSPPRAALSNPFLFMLRRNYGRRFLKRDKRSVVKYSHHGSIGDSRPKALVDTRPRTRASHELTSSGRMEEIRIRGEATLKPLAFSVLRRRISFLSSRPPA